MGLRCALGLLACLQHARLLWLIVFCAGNKNSPEVSFQHVKWLKGPSRGINFNAAA